jgi:hypothetical protein
MRAGAAIAHAERCSALPRGVLARPARRKPLVPAPVVVAVVVVMWDLREAERRRAPESDEQGAAG